MMCLTSADALSRYLLNRPILGAYEITEKYLMVAAIFLGLSYAYRGGVFIRVTFLVDRLPPALKLAVNHVVHLVSLAFCLVVLVATDPAGAARLAGRHDAQRAADPGRAGLLPRAARLSRADPVCSSTCRGCAAASPTCSREEAPAGMTASLAEHR